jgi:hypothetical protein
MYLCRRTLSATLAPPHASLARGAHAASPARAPAKPAPIEDPRSLAAATARSTGPIGQGTQRTTSATKINKQDRIRHTVASIRMILLAPASGAHLRQVASACRGADSIVG